MNKQNNLKRKAMINTFHIQTGMGHYYGNLPFLNDDQLKEFNSIGYSGKLTNGTPINREAYLNSLNKGEFQVTQTEFDNGDFTEAFTIVWVS